MEKWIYDLEVFPNFFSGTFLNNETDEVVTFYSHQSVNQIPEMLDFVKGKRLVGYNNFNYDNVILNKLYDKDLSLKEIYKLSQDLVNCEFGKLWRDFKGFVYPKKFTSIDLMKVTAFDKLMVSLKQCSVNLRHDRIQDLPKPFNELVLTHEVDKILEYNLNDCIITKKLHLAVIDDLKLREDLTIKYDEDVMNESNTGIGKKIMRHYYKIDDPSERTNRSRINFKDAISDRIEFQTEKGEVLLSQLKKMSVKETKGSLKHIVKFGNTDFKMGTGGLHSVDSPAWFESDEKSEIIDCDVTSMYPSIMLKYKIKPAHLNDDFFEVLQGLVTERLDAKFSGDMVTANALKITINSIYGLLNFKYFWLYDPLAAMSVTVNGQLMLLMLIEHFVEAGIEVLSANTDGVTCRVNKDQKEKYYKICKHWEKQTLLDLEYVNYRKYIRRDVNNYIVLTEEGKLKKKGCFITDTPLQKAFKHPIVPKALEAYFIADKPIMETLKNCDDILEFCKSVKVGNQFVTYLDELEGSEMRSKPQQKTNRYYVSKSGGALVKQRKDESKGIKRVAVEKGYLTTIINDLADDYKTDNVDLEYYKSECYKIINKIRPEGQDTLF